ncbi:MAG: hypothetical protein IPG89_08335 [Bacteroidetes bacterium]|nr:hypothetical protein [Bacteroidota bacterium]
MTNLEEEKIEAIQNFLSASRKLKELGIINNKRDFTSQLGEWLISEMYGATLADNGKQQDWDMQLDGKFIQVKTHSKANTTSRSETDFKYSDNAKIDVFIIVVFTEDYILKEIFEIPWKLAIQLKTKDTKTPVITWSKIPKDCRINLEEKFESNKLLRFFIRN